MSLDRDLLAAHAAGDSVALVDLYARAAREAAGPDRRAFFLTQAHVFAMEVGHPAAGALRDELVAAGRESPLPALNPKRR